MKKIPALKNRMLRPLSDESGSTVVIALLILLTLTILGIAAIDTTSIEIQIARNDRIYQQNVNLAEAGARRAARRIENMDGNGMDPDSDYAALYPGPGTGWITKESNNFFEDSANWDSDGENPNSASAGKYRYTANFIGKQGGSGLNPGDLSVNVYAIYGIAENLGGQAIIQMGCKKTVSNP